MVVCIGATVREGNAGVRRRGNAGLARLGWSNAVEIGQPLPQVCQRGISPDDPARAAHAFDRTARALLDRNPDVVLNHMHDPIEELNSADAQARSGIRDECSKPGHFQHFPRYSACSTKRKCAVTLGRILHRRDYRVGAGGADEADLAEVAAHREMMVQSFHQHPAQQRATVLVQITVHDHDGQVAHR